MPESAPGTGNGHGAGSGKYIPTKTGTYAQGGDGRKQNKPLHPSMRPIAGINQTPTNIRTGRIYNIDPTATAKGVGKYAFNFMYNPNAISQNTTINWDINYDPRSSFTTLPNAQTLNFELMLNRINDIRDPNPKYAVPTGTLHDLEYLYRTINGDPATQNGILSADFGFLVPTQLQVFFGSKFSYVGYITDLSISHAMFQHDMIPVYTTVGITMSRALNPASTASATDPPTSPGNGSKTGGGYTGF